MFNRERTVGLRTVPYVGLGLLCPGRHYRVLSLDHR